MRIGVVGDSHGNLFMLDKALNAMQPLDLIVHLGDECRDIIRINEKYKIPIEYVSGNNDFGINNIYEKVLNIGGKKIFITHGHKYRVSYGLEALYFKALEVGADLVLYGHTHVQAVDRNGEVLFLSPGSVSRPRDRKPGCAVVIIDGRGEIDVNLLHLDF